MHCRYCSAVYEKNETACARCGAPKTALREKLLDAQASPAHWSRSLRASMLHLGMAAAAVALLVRLFGGNEGPGALAQFAVILWVIWAAPLLLIYASWKSAAKGAGVGRWLLLGRNLAASLIFWIAGLTLLIWALDPAVYVEEDVMIEALDENASKN